LFFCGEFWGRGAFGAHGETGVKVPVWDGMGWDGKGRKEGRKEGEKKTFSQKQSKPKKTIQTKKKNSSNLKIEIQKT